MEKLLDFVETENQRIFVNKQLFACGIQIVIVFLQTGYGLHDRFLKVWCQRSGKYIVNLMDFREWNLACQIFPYIVVKITDTRLAVAFEMVLQPSTVQEAVAIVRQIVLKASNIYMKSNIAALQVPKKLMKCLIQKRAIVGKNLICILGKAFE